MKNFNVHIEEHISGTFEVEADSLEEAIEIATEKYYDGEFVNEPGNVTALLMQAETPDCKECTEWVEID